MHNNFHDSPDLNAWNILHFLRFYFPHHSPLLIPSHNLPKRKNNKLFWNAVLKSNGYVSSNDIHSPDPRAFELVKIRSCKFPSPRAKIVSKCPTLSSDLSLKLSLLKSDRRQSSLIWLVYKHMATHVSWPFLPDSSYYNHNFKYNIETVKNDLKLNYLTRTISISKYKLL